MIRPILFLSALTVIFIFPLLVLGLYSAAGLWQYPDILPETYSIRAFEYIHNHAASIILSIISSLFYSVCTVFLTFLISVLPAHVFARFTFKYKTILEALLLAPALVPSITFSMGIHILFIITGIADSIFGIILILTIYSYPYMFRALISGFKAYGREYDICAKNLGAGILQRILQIDIPLILPSFVAGGTVVFLVAFSEYFLVFLIGGGLVPSFTGYLFPFLNSSDRPVASLLTLLFFIMPILLFIIIELTVNRMYRKRGLMK